MRAAGAWLLVALWAGFAPAAAAAECPPGEGTTVVVDFGELEGGVQVGCAPSAATGFEALAEAGFAVERVQSNPAFLCRIDGRPDGGAEDCTDIPPDTAFWSYWSADLGGEWQFQVTGAGGAIGGDLEGWAFATGDAAPPRHPVPAAPTTTTTTSTTTTTEASTTTTTTTTTAPTTTTSSPPTTTPPSTTLTTTTTLPTTTTTTPTTPSTTTTTRSTSAPSTAPTSGPTTLAATGPEEDGGAGGIVAAALGLAGVGAASWLVARRRFGEGGP